MILQNAFYCRSLAENATYIINLFPFRNSHQGQNPTLGGACTPTSLQKMTSGHPGKQLQQNHLIFGLKIQI